MSYRVIIPKVVEHKLRTFERKDALYVLEQLRELASAPTELIRRSVSPPELPGKQVFEFDQISGDVSCIRVHRW